MIHGRLPVLDRNESRTELGLLLNRFADVLDALRREKAKVKRAHKKLQETAITDSLTGMYNRRYLQEVTGRKMILWNGACSVHEIFSVADLLKMKRKIPDAVTIAHPECPANIREHADYIGGTQGMLKYVADLSQPKDILVATEINMLWQLQHQSPQHRYHPVPGVTCACNRCPFMARNTLQALRDCLQKGKPEIHWQASFDKSREVLQRSLLPAGTRAK